MATETPPKESQTEVPVDDFDRPALARGPGLIVRPTKRKQLEQSALDGLHFVSA